MGGPGELFEELLGALPAHAGVGDALAVRQQALGGSVLAPVDQPPKQLMFIPALLVLGLIVFMQRGRRKRQSAAADA